MPRPPHQTPPRRHRRPFLALLLLGATWTGCSGGGSGAAPIVPDPDPIDLGPTPFPVFDDVASAIGITAEHRATPNYWPAGLAFGDYDRDGWPDLYVTSAAGPNVLYRNLGNGQFAASPLAAQVALPAVSSGGAVFADYDNDGWLDLYVLNDGPNTLYHNDGGQGFTDVTATAGVGDSGASSSAAFGDYDRDGHLDLYVANWACLSCPDFRTGMRDHLYRNRGDGTFADVTPLLGPYQTSGFGNAVTFADLDDDGDQDLYLVNDKGTQGADNPTVPLRRNVLWRNDGPGAAPGDWVFTEIAVAARADSRICGMGVACGDYDNDGRLDLAASSNDACVLLHNDASIAFSDLTTAAGVGVRFAIGWGMFFADLNNDRHQDLYLAVATGKPRLFRNAADGTFADVANQSLPTAPQNAVGAAYADYDRDGWLDFATCNRGTGFDLFHNRGVAGRGHWLRIRLEGRNGVNRDAVGARVRVRTDDGTVQTREVCCGSSFASGHELTLHFGLGDLAVTELGIRWPDGLIETFPAVARDREWVFVHP